MDEWVLCTACGYLRERLVELACCKYRLCSDCISSHPFCPRCVTAIQEIDGDAAGMKQRQSSARNAEDVLVQCRYKGCEYRCVDVLMSKHMETCEHSLAYATGDSAPELLRSLQDPVHGPDAVRALRRKNVFKRYMKYDNIRKAYAAAERRMVDGSNQNAGETPGEPEPVAEPTETKHAVLPTDTIEGLSLMYDVEIADIRKRNNLRGPVWERSFIFIPNGLPTDPQRIDVLEKALKRKLIGEFKKTAHGATSEEALYYLDCADYDLTEALSSFLADAQWEGPRTKIPAPKAESEFEDPKGCVERLFDRWFGEVPVRH